LDLLGSAPIAVSIGATASRSPDIYAFRASEVVSGL
jgi:hypothetical protein